MNMFEIIKQMNEGDAANGTAHVGVCNSLVAVDKKGDNGTVTIGVPGSVAQEMALGQSNKRAILLIIDMDEYNKYVPARADR